MKHLQQEAQFFYLSLFVLATQNTKDYHQNCESKHRPTDKKTTSDKAMRPTQRQGERERERARKKDTQQNKWHNVPWSLVVF